VGDSAACATALLCGVKGNFETLGLDSRGRYEDCSSVNKSKVPSIVDWAQREGTAQIILIVLRQRNVKNWKRMILSDAKRQSRGEDPHLILSLWE
jgi:hypothetical protein